MNAPTREGFAVGQRVRVTLSRQRANDWSLPLGRIGQTGTIDHVAFDDDRRIRFDDDGQTWFVPPDGLEPIDSAPVVPAPTPRFAVGDLVTIANLSGLYVDRTEDYIGLSASIRNVDGASALMVLTVPERHTRWIPLENLRPADHIEPFTDDMGRQHEAGAGEDCPACQQAYNAAEERGRASRERTARRERHEQRIRQHLHIDSMRERIADPGRRWEVTKRTMALYLRITGSKDLFYQHHCREWLDGISAPTTNDEYDRCIDAILDKAMEDREDGTNCYEGTMQFMLAFGLAELFTDPGTRCEGCDDSDCETCHSDCDSDCDTCHPMRDIEISVVIRIRAQTNESHYVIRREAERLSLDINTDIEYEDIDYEVTGVTID